MYDHDLDMNQFNIGHQGCAIEELHLNTNTRTNVLNIVGHQRLESLTSTIYKEYQAMTDGIGSCIVVPLCKLPEFEHAALNEAADSSCVL